jgi:hypothetical protein
MRQDRRWENQAAMYTEPRSACPINAALECLRRTWALPVLRDVTCGNRRHANSEVSIATNIPCQPLEALRGFGTAHPADCAARIVRDLTGEQPRLDVGASLHHAGVARYHRPRSPPSSRQSLLMTALRKAPSARAGNTRPSRPCAASCRLPAVCGCPGGKSRAGPGLRSRGIPRRGA